MPTSLVRTSQVPASLVPTSLVQTSQMPTFFVLAFKSACNWEKAIYKGYKDTEKFFEWIVDEKANQQYIEQLKQDKASDPKTPVDCSR